MKYRDKQIDVLERIGRSILEYYDDDLTKTSRVINSMYISDVHILNAEVIFVLRRPGVLIGPRGELVHRIQQDLDMKIKIIEDTATHATDYITPTSYSLEGY
jgi:ribosomal protein S3